MAAAAGKGSGRVPDLPDNEAKVMAGVWARMKNIYGHLWSSNFKGDDQLKMAQHDWLNTFRRRGYTTGDVSRALDYCAEKIPNMPNLPAFCEIVKLCKQDAARAQERQAGHLCLPESEEQSQARAAHDDAERRRFAEIAKNELKSIKAIFDGPK